MKILDLLKWLLNLTIAILFILSISLVIKQPVNTLVSPIAMLLLLGEGILLRFVLICTDESISPLAALFSILVLAFFLSRGAVLSLLPGYFDPDLLPHAACDAAKCFPSQYSFSSGDFTMAALYVLLGSVVFWLGAFLVARLSRQPEKGSDCVHSLFIDCSKLNIIMPAVFAFYALFNLCILHGSMSRLLPLFTFASHFINVLFIVLLFIVVGIASWQQQSTTAKISLVSWVTAIYILESITGTKGIGLQFLFFWLLLLLMNRQYAQLTRKTFKLASICLLVCLLLYKPAALCRSYRDIPHAPSTTELLINSLAGKVMGLPPSTETTASEQTSATEKTVTNPSKDKNPEKSIVTYPPAKPAKPATTIETSQQQTSYAAMASLGNIYKHSSLFYLFSLRLNGMDPLVAITSGKTRQPEDIGMDCRYCLKSFIDMFIPKAFTGRHKLFPEAEIGTYRLSAYLYYGYTMEWIRNNYYSNMWTMWGINYALFGFWGGLLVMGVLGGVMSYLLVKCNTCKFMDNTLVRVFSLYACSKLLLSFGYEDDLFVIINLAVTWGLVIAVTYKWSSRSIYSHD